MKHLRYIRHADKVGELVPQTGLDTAQTVILAGTYTDVFYGLVYRTVQTILALTCALGCKAKVHEPIEQIGTNEAFAIMFPADILELIKGGLANLQAVDHHPEALKWQQWCADGVREMFSRIEDGGSGLAVGHDPLISLAARHFGWQDARSLKTLEYVDFKEEGGKITVLGAGPA